MKTHNNYIEDNNINVYVGSDNIFADIGCVNPDDMMVKSRLVMQIEKEIKTRGLTQVNAARLIGITQPKISQIFRGNFRDISEEKLLNCLNRLGYDVNISVKKHTGVSQDNNMTIGHTTLSFA